MDQVRKVEIKMSLAERELLAKETYADSHLMARLQIAELKGKEIRTSIALDELDVLLGDIAFAINHATDRKLESQLSKLYDRLSAIEEAALRRTRKGLPGDTGHA